MASPSSTIKVTYVGSGATASVSHHTTKPSTASAAPPAIAPMVLASSVPASPATVAAAFTLPPDASRLSAYVTRVRRHSAGDHTFGPSTHHVVRVASRATSTAASPAVGFLGMRTAYTPVATSTTTPRSSVAPVPSSQTRLAPGGASTASLGSASVVASSTSPLPHATPLEKPPVTQYMSECVYASLRDAAGRPLAPPPLDLVPPFRFAMVEDGVYRGAYPVLRNFPFLKHLGIRHIISLVPEDPTYDLQTFCESEHITLHHIQAERFKGETQLLPTDLNAALNLIMSVDTHPTYIHCLDGRQVVGLVVMGLRKLMQWDVPRAHQEYLRFCAGEVEDEVAFLTDYTGPLTVPRQVPTWLAGLYAVDPRGVRHPRKYNCGIKLKYPAEAPRSAGTVEPTAVTGAAAASERGGAVAANAPDTSLALPAEAAVSGAASGTIDVIKPFAPLSAPSAAGALASAEGKLAAEEVSAALAISLPWSTLVGERGVYFDTGHVGHAHPPSAVPASAGQTTPSADGGSGGRASQHARRGSQGSSGGGRHHHHHRQHHDGRGGSAESPSYKAASVGGNVSRDSSANASMVFSHHGGAVASRSQRTSAASTPPIAPSQEAPSAPGNATATLTAAVGTGPNSSTASSASPHAASLLAATPAVSLAYFGLGRPGSSLSPLPSSTPVAGTDWTRVATVERFAAHAASPAPLAVGTARGDSGGGGGAVASTAAATAGSTGTVANTAAHRRGESPVGVGAGVGGQGEGRPSANPQVSATPEAANGGSKPRPKRRYSL